MKISRKEKGFTLIELLIVMVILGLLAAMVGPRMFGKVGKSKQKAAKAQISLLETSLDTYRLDVGKYPTTQQGLQALRVKPDGAEKWDGPYLPKDIPLDPWGNPYVYESPGKHGDYDIISLGADKSPGGGVTIWISRVGQISSNRARWAVFHAMPERQRLYAS